MEPLLDASRNAPTARSYRHGQPFRRGADIAPTSSLPFFLLIGIGVGLFAFAMMSFCLPDPFAKIAARDARRDAQQAFPPPVFKPIEVAPPVAEVVAPPPAPVTTSVAVKARAARRPGGSKKAKAN
jgi:hypothetical protein